MRILYLIPLTLLVFYWRGQTFDTGPIDSIKKSTQSTVVTTPIQANTPLFMCDRMSDSLELVKFYNATGGPNWWKKWDLKKPMVTWYGVLYTAEGCVSSIILYDTITVSGCTDCQGSGNHLLGSLISLNLPILQNLNLSNNQLTGTIPNFDKLSNLIVLSLSFNQLTGTIPNFDKLTNLQDLLLFYNQLTGTIPNFDKLSNLQDLWLSSNQLTGTVPNFDKLPILQYLDLYGNKLTGTIPNFDKLPNLQYLGLDVNQLIGTIPNFDKLPNLQNLYLRNNQLTGTIPNFDKLPNLLYLYLSSNQLTGTTPNFDKLLNLQYLELSINQLTGTIPNFNKLTNLRYLYLFRNQLTGAIPNFDKLPNLQNLQLFSNQLTGTIPNFDKLPNLNALVLSNNQLTGTIPNFDKLSNLQDLWLSNNQLTGPIHDHTLTNPKLTRYVLNNNRITFSGLIRNLKTVKNLTDIINNSQIDDTLRYAPQQKIYSDTTITIQANTNYTLDLKIDDTVTTSTYTWYKNGVLDTIIKGKNKLPFTPFTTADAGTYTVKITNPHAPQLTLESWPIRLVVAPSMVCDRRSDSLELVKFYNATGGPNWWKKWDLKKPISEWHGIGLQDGCVVSIDLEDTVEDNSCCNGSGNNLIGSIPVFNLPFLKLLDLGINKLSGVIPNFDGIPNLNYLSLYGNQLTGSIPNFNNLPNLSSMDLGANRLTGFIPNFDKIPLLNRLVLDENQLTGTIPNFDKLPNLNTLSLSINPLTGTIPNFDKIPSLVSLGLVKNQLTGSIPNFNNLPNLETLQLRINELTGSIPNFDKLPKLISMALSNNFLDGQIPEFNKLPRLVTLELGSNKLTGLLPTFLNCPQLTDIYVERNNLKGYLPDYSIILPNLSSIVMNDNKFTFSGITQNTNRILVQTMKVSNGRMIYHPQQCINSDTTISVPSASNYTLDLKIDDTVTTSTYTWSKDGVFYKAIKGINKLTFLPFTSNDAGTYTVKITNPLAPQLTLESCPIRLVTSPPLVCDRRSDSLELVKLYNATGGPNWWKKWDLKKPIDTWWGIILNSEGCVSGINQGDTVLDKGCCVYIGNNLTGTLVSLNLPNLINLSLNDNKLTGSIPNFSQLPNLLFLALSANQFGDRIPNFDKMPNLIYLGLYHNRLTGSIPNFDNLPKLSSLQLGENQLSGDIPNFDKIPILDRLGLGQNMLTGSIPNFNLPVLVTLALGGNQLTGDIPNFDKLPNLGGLGLNDNKLTGSVPNFDKLLTLESLHLFDNQLTGFIPNFIKIRSLKQLRLDNNKLTGFIPNFENLPKLIELWLNANNLEGFIPDYSIYNPHLNLSYIYGNKLTFSSLIKNFNSNKNLIEVINIPTNGFAYFQQQKIYIDTTINIPANTNYSLDLKIDDTVTTSTYTWFKNGVLDTIIKGKNILPITPFTTADAGTYTVKITNPHAPQLTLESWPIRLVTSCINRPVAVLTISQHPSCSNSKDGRLIPDFSNITGSGPFRFAWLGEGLQVGNNFTGVGILPSRLVVTDSKGCTDTATVTLKPLIDNNIILKSDQQTVKNKTPQLFDVLSNDNIPVGVVVNVTIDNPQNGTMIYSLTTGKGTYTPKTGFSGKEKLNYKVCPTACPTDCLSSTIEFEVETPCADKTNLVLPNVIFPDGPTGANRYFFVEALEKCKEAFGPRPTKLSVYNRWGDLVFYSKDYLNNWEGTNNQGQPLPAGTYYYLLDLGSQAAPVKGYVVIMR